MVVLKYEDKYYEDKEYNKQFVDVMNGGGSGGTTNYEDLTNKPKINGVELSGDVDLTNSMTSDQKTKFVKGIKDDIVTEVSPNIEENVITHLNFQYKEID